MLRFVLLIILAAGLGAFLADRLPPEQALSQLQAFAPIPAPREQQVPVPSTRPQQQLQQVALARPLPVCGSGRRTSCVVDGDTFWLAGEKVRLEGVDAPEINGACAHERDLAQKATRRLSEILSAQQLELHRSGRDRYQRTLARVDTPNGEAGEILIREGLARPWKGRKEQWCS